MPSTEDELGIGLDLQERARACLPARVECVAEMFTLLDQWYAEADPSRR